MRVVYIVLLIISALVLSFTVYDYNSLRTIRNDAGLDIGRKTANDVKNHLDSIFTYARGSMEGLVKKIATSQPNEAIIKNLIKEQSEKLNFLSGIAVAFEPYAFSPDRELRSFYYQNMTKKFIEIEDRYNYLDTTLETANWYTKTVKAGKLSITKPYFGEAAQELSVDFSVPIYKEANGNKQLYGVLTYSISPDRFTEVVNSFVQGNSGYVYLTNAQGNIITHPNRSYILNMQILDFAYTQEQKSMVDKIISTDSGHLRYTSPYTGVPSILFYQTLDFVKWKVAVIYSFTDLMGSPKTLERKITHIVLAGSFVVLFILMIGLKIYQWETAKIWQLSVITSVLLVLNIAALWIIQLDLDYSEELKNTTRVYSSNALNSYVSKRNYEKKLLGKQQFTSIPTGIFIEELLVSDSYNMSVSGKIWQKWPIDHDLKDNRGFHFIQASPQGRSVIVELLSKDRLDSATWLYTWKFNATLRIFFDYDQFPLDQHYINVKLIYPDMTDDIMLVPDFESYEVLNPSSKPGLSDNLFLPKHRLIASYFSFSSMDLKAFFGQNRMRTSPQYETLEYNIVIKRRFITPFVSFVIPFIIGASIIFFLLYSLNKRKDDNSGVTVMGVVQGMAALFFSMLLAHITIRNKIPSPHITYLETYYFVIYVLIVLLIIIVVMYSRSDRYKFLNYKDNLIVKAVYWPAFFSMLYIITLISFY